MTFEEYQNFFDFGYKKEVDGYAFIDFQGAYLGGIADERYSNPLGLAERLSDSVYFEDYVLKSEELSDFEDLDIEEIYKFLDNDSYLKELIFYTLNLDQLTNIPFTLDIDCKEIYETAYQKLLEDIQKEAKEKGYPYVKEINAMFTDTPHFVKFLMFKNKEELDSYENATYKSGTYFPRISKHIEDYYEIENTVEEEIDYE